MGTSLGGSLALRGDGRNRGSYPRRRCWRGVRPFSGIRVSREPEPRIRNRFSLMSGILASLLYLAIAAVLADAPAANATGEVVLAWATRSRTAILVVTPVWTLSVAAIFAFYISVEQDLLARSVTGAQGSLAILGTVGGFLTFFVSLLGFLLLTSLAWMAPEVDPGIARLLSVVSLLSVNLTGLPTALTLLPWSWVMYQRQLASVPLLAFGVVVATLHCISACSFGTEGLTSPSGIGVYAAPPLFYVWVVWLGLLKFRD